MRTVLIVDGQGGGCGRALVERLHQRRPPNCRIVAVGTNAMATAAMLKAGADAGATGENPVVVNSATAQVIAGPIGIVLANALLGEVTPTMAAAIAASNAQRVLVPLNRCATWVVGVQDAPMSQYIEEAVSQILSYLAQ